MKRLNIGCGKDIKEGWLNLDSAKLPGVDIVHDIQKLPLPFKDEEFDEILCQDVLEHIEYIPVLKDIHRILKQTGKLTIRVPHFTSKNNYIDPTHTKRFSIYTFEMFCENSPLSKPKERDYYFDFKFNKILSSKIRFDKSSRWLIYNRLIEPIINFNKTTKFLFESTGWCYSFPAQNIEIILTK